MSHLELLWGPDSSSRDQLRAKADVIGAMHESSCARTRRQNLPSCTKLWVSVAPTTFCECTATRSCRRNELLKSSTRLDGGLLRGSFKDGGQLDASHTQRRPVLNWIKKRSRDIAVPAHMGALTAARPRIQAMIQGAVTAILLRRPLEARLTQVIETATSTYQETGRRSMATNSRRAQRAQRYEPNIVATRTARLLKMMTAKTQIFLRASEEPAQCTAARLDSGA